ncbi:hypothetical protein ABZ949_02020 [Micromonospora tulbaghiae]|uniref:hypothetical protein n=1 Tax=Micromonospora tulbaghiae TaxID=479978 RepID=UPI0033E1193C
MRYIIGYSYDNGRGEGNCVVSLPRPIATQEDIDSIGRKIAAETGFASVVITDHRPLTEAAN